MEKVLLEHGLFELLEEEKEYLMDGEKIKKKRTYVKRPPGVRAILLNEKNEILLSKEYRYELESFDYRLPGGKVFDNYKDYKEAISKNNIENSCLTAVKKEVKEEVGIEVSNPVLYGITHAGSSITWDLYYFLVKDYKIIPNGTELEEGEIITGFVWKSFEEIINMCIERKINEDRSIGVLLTYILETEKKKRSEENG